MITHRDIQDVCYLKTENGRKQFYENQKDVFWPFNLWRVAAPKTNPVLNIFQMLLLKLIHAGCRDNEKLNRYSNLDNELIRYVLAQLTNEGYLDGWNITIKAKNLLSGIEESSSEKTNYYLLQDATTGKLMPRVLTKLPHIEGMDFNNPYPQFVQSRGSGKPIKPLLISNTVKPEVPTAEQMNTCLRSYRRELNQLKQADIYVADTTLEVTYSIEFIESEPIAAYLHTKLFSNITGERSWYLSDPSGLTETLAELNESAEQLMESHKQFASRVHEVIGIAEEGYVSSYQAQMLQFEELAKVEMLSKYPWVQKYPLIEKHLLGMLRLKMQVVHESHPRFELLHSLLNEQQRVIEAWVKAVIQPNKSNDEWKIFLSGWDKNRGPIYQENKKIRENVYCRVDGISKEVGSQLSHVRPNKIRSALTYGDESLRPLIIGMLLKDPIIFEAIHKEYPRWLELIFSMAVDRDSIASHAGGKSISKKEVLDHLNSVDDLLIVLEKYLGNK